MNKAFPKFQIEIQKIKNGESKNWLVKEAFARCSVPVDVVFENDPYVNGVFGIGIDVQNRFSEPMYAVFPVYHPKDDAFHFFVAVNDTNLVPTFDYFVNSLLASFGHYYGIKDVYVNGGEWVDIVINEAILNDFDNALNLLLYLCVVMTNRTLFSSRTKK